MTAQQSAHAPEFTPQWLALREEADAAARSVELLGPLRAHLAARPPAGPLVIRDLGCGTGSMGRWLAGRLPGPQHWILHDRDPRLLARAAASVTGPAADGGEVTVQTDLGDITRLDPDLLAGTSLVTASALLDLLTAAEVDALAASCAAAGCPALLTISVTGRVELDPPGELDAELGAAFNDHQRRKAGGRRLLGPDAVPAAAAAFTARGAQVLVRPSPWRLAADQGALIGQWLRGWVGAACEQRPELLPRARGYLERRLAECAAGALTVVVHHDDLLALPAAGASR
ncbi:class I SAM-dependent methyltransferase [Thermomonospora sp. CIF 1]|uniref:class I SAM-dependent methyltransferase n=1 Tax=Thermomonospora sp. CIF 1 TaxID=1916083 RepID=UPI000AAACCB2|nr:class I SAM-dependent methyltransferase [Thermomonospora sp. CIF 1]PKK13463.1 MAG: SAM-dependent methyltransferase [Thermomonospora sp. CIF 1]